MHFFDRVWAGVVYVFSVVTFNPVHDGVVNQVPMSVPSRLASPPHSPSPSLSYAPSSVSVAPHVGETDFPIFHPPGGEDDLNFTCKYPAMVGWEDCSSSRDRKCWLRRKSDGKQFDVNTNYENEWPIGVTRHYEIDIADGSWAADGLHFDEAKLFNKKYPGPWIQACWGDRLVVKVTNSLSHNGTSVHWHGIRQHDSVHMDGVNGVTQCPIAPKDYFVYDFTIKQYGSSWYHSHYSVQYADGAAGPLTIHGPSSADWDEAISPPLIMTDWYHKSSFHVLTNPGDTGGKDILLNGRGDIRKFDSKAKNETEVKPPYHITFDQPRVGQGCKKYLLRVINTSFDTTFVFSIDNHLLQIVSADFVPIQPYHNTSILVGIGQRYNVIVEANPRGAADDLDPNGNYWIRTEIAPCFKGSLPGSPGYAETGVLRYNASSDKMPTSKRWNDISTDCSDETYTSLNPILPWVVGEPVNGPHGTDLQVYYNSKRANEDYPVSGFTMDGEPAGLPMRVDYSNPTFLDLAQEEWPPLARVVPENFTDKKWIYLVIRGAAATGQSTGAHPARIPPPPLTECDAHRSEQIHLHGHDFAILEQAAGKKWDPATVKLKRVNPPRRDVVLLPTDGYVVIAFKADNPGPWLVHCHIAVHISMGLGMQIMEDQPGAYGLWPAHSPAVVEANRVCDNWKIWYGNKTNWAFAPTPEGDCTYPQEGWCFQDDSGV